MIFEGLKSKNEQNPGFLMDNKMGFGFGPLGSGDNNSQTFSVELVAPLKSPHTTIEHPTI